MLDNLDIINTTNLCIQRLDDGRPIYVNRYSVYDREGGVWRKSTDLTCARDSN